MGLGTYIKQGVESARTFCKNNRDLLNAGAVGVGVFANIFLGLNAIGSINERNASIFNKK